MDSDSEMSDCPPQEMSIGRRYADILREVGVDDATFVALGRERYTPAFVAYKRRRLRALRQLWVSYHGSCGRCASEAGEAIFDQGFPAHQFRSLSAWDVCDICPHTELAYVRYGDPIAWDGSPLDMEMDSLLQLCSCCSYRYIPFPTKEKIL